MTHINNQKEISLCYNHSNPLLRYELLRGMNQLTH